MEITVDVHSTDVFLFPSKRQRPVTSPISSSSFSSSSSSSTTPSSEQEDLEVGPCPYALASSSTSTTTLVDEGRSPAYSELESKTIFSNKLSNDDHALLYAYVDIRIPASNSASGSKIKNKLKSLTLTLSSTESISFPLGGFEQSHPFSSTKSISEAVSQPYFEPGRTYRFERSFFIDHNSAPFQRSPWGVNNQKLTAKATFHGLLSKSLTATKKVYFVDCQSDEPDAIVWEKDVRTHADGIGPFVLRNRSDVFTVGGYLRTNFDLLSPMDGVQIVGLRGFVEQRTTLASRKERKGYIETVQPKKVQFLSLDQRQVAELFKTKKLQGGGEGVSPEGDCYPALEVVSRLPDDNKIRPSTVEGNDAAIRFKNFIDYEIDFIDGEYLDPSEQDGEMVYVDNQKMKRFHVSMPIFLNSCGCRPDSLNLPTYASVDPMPVECIREEKERLEREMHDKQTDPSAYPCICTFTLESLLEVEKKAMVGEGERRSGEFAEDFLPTYKCFE